eukprot:11103298-Alexandrium_andersonii.AAC.1
MVDERQGRQHRPASTSTASMDTRTVTASTSDKARARARTIRMTITGAMMPRRTRHNHADIE